MDSSHWNFSFSIEGGPIHYTKNGKSSVVGKFFEFFEVLHILPHDPDEVNQKW